MGCSENRGNISEEENIIMQKEFEIGFRNHTAEFVDFLIRKYSSEGSINPDQWNEIVKQLNLENSKSEFQTFYQQFQLEEGKLSMRMILILGILESKSPPSEKMKLLFDAEDTESYEFLSSEGLTHLVEDIVKISCYLIPRLAQHEKNKVSQYIYHMYTVQPKAVDIIADTFAGKTLNCEIRVTRNILQRNMIDPNISKLVFPHSIRQFVHELSQERNVHRTMTTLELEEREFRSSVWEVNGRNSLKSLLFLICSAYQSQGRMASGNLAYRRKPKNLMIMV